MDENEMRETLFQVAKMRAEFELLKNAILNHLELDYSGERLELRDDRLIIEVMETIEPDQIMSILASKKMEREEKLKKISEENDNG